MCKEFNDEVVRRWAKDPRARENLKFETPHLLKLAHGRATEMYVARHKLQGQQQIQFSAYRAKSRDKVPAIMRLMFDRSNASKAQLKEKAKKDE